MFFFSKRERYGGGGREGGLGGRGGSAEHMLTLIIVSTSARESASSGASPLLPPCQPPVPVPVSVPVPVPIVPPSPALSRRFPSPPSLALFSPLCVGWLMSVIGIILAAVPVFVFGIIVACCCLPVSANLVYIIIQAFGIYSVSTCTFFFFCMSGCAAVLYFDARSSLSLFPTLSPWSVF